MYQACKDLYICNLQVLMLNSELLEDVTPEEKNEVMAKYPPVVQHASMDRVTKALTSLTIPVCSSPSQVIKTKSGSIYLKGGQCPLTCTEGDMRQPSNNCKPHQQTRARQMQKATRPYIGSCANTGITLSVSKEL